MSDLHKSLTSGNWEYHLVQGVLYITSEKDPDNQVALTAREIWDLLEYLYELRDDIFREKLKESEKGRAAHEGNDEQPV